MEARKLSPWNWFRSEENRDRPSQGAVTPWYSPVPFGSLSQMHRDIDRMFDDMLRGFGGTPLRSDRLPALANENLLLRPNIDIASTDKEYRITVEVPGVDEKNIRLEATDDMLTIRGEKKQERKEEKQDVYSTECAYGAFKRTLSLPEDAHPDKIGASFRNGVLTIALPRRKTAKASSRQIPVKHAA